MPQKQGKQIFQISVSKIQTSQVAICKAWPSISTRDYRETNPESGRVKALNREPPDYNTSALNHSATLPPIAVILTGIFLIVFRNFFSVVSPVLWILSFYWILSYYLVRLVRTGACLLTILKTLISTYTSAISISVTTNNLRSLVYGVRSFL